MSINIARRQFIVALGSAASAWPLGVRAQQLRGVRRVGVLMSSAADDSLGQTNIAAFAQGLQQLGWEVGTNVRIDTRWGANDTERFRKYAADLVASAPDVIVGTAASIVGDLQQASRTVPIVFVTTIDPVGSGLVASLAHPGGNITGFTAGFLAISAVWIVRLVLATSAITVVPVILTSGSRRRASTYADGALCIATAR